MNFKTDFTKLLLTGFFIIAMRLVAFANTAADGYDIKIKLNDYAKDTLLLGYQLGNQSYIRDTAVLDKSSGFFTFKGKEKLKAGIYLVVMLPDNNYFQVMINDNEQNFAIETTTQDPYTKAKLKDTKDNDLFFGYMNYLAEKRKDAEAANALRAKDSIASSKKLTALDLEVKAYQANLLKNQANSVTALLIKTAMEVEGPKFDDIKDKEQRDIAMYYYYKQHWFDNFDMANPALLRSPVLFQRVDYYIEKLTPQHPDSILQSLDRIFELTKPAKETFQFYFVHYLNQYAKSKLVGFDAVYVNMAKKYIDTGLTDAFIEKENKEKILTNAAKLYPILIGKVAPDINVFMQDSTFNEKTIKRINLHSVKSKYTILFFYAPDCGHCQKQSPDLVAFFKKAKEKNMDLKVFATCTYVNTDKMPECLKYIKEKGFGDFINTMDPYMISRYKTLYNVETTPQIFVLDENKVIRSKSIEAKQLEDVMDFIIGEDNEKLKKETKSK
jgi:thiol-disulfide isomerase/thioredoxin